MSAGRLLAARLSAARLVAARPRFIVGAGPALPATYADGITVGKPGRCGHEPVLVIAGFDNSGSITGGADPVGQRFLECRIAVERVGRRCRCGRDLVAVYHFDTPTSLDLDATPVRDSERIHEHLALPPDGAGASAMLASLRAARRQAQSHPSHRAIYVPFTDFALFDDYLGELLAFPGEVHAVALNGSPPAALDDAPRVTVTHVTHASRPGIVARALFMALTTTREGAQPLPANELATADVN